MFCKNTDATHTARYSHPFKAKNIETLLNVFPQPVIDGIEKDPKVTVAVIGEDLNRDRVAKNFYSKTKGAGKIKLIMSVNRADEKDRFKPYAKGPDRYYLWHGTGEAAVPLILATGLKCNCQGKCFFAPNAQQSNWYAQNRGQAGQKQYFMFVAEVYGPVDISSAPITPADTEPISPGLSFITRISEYTVSTEDRIRLRYLLVYTL